MEESIRHLVHYQATPDMLMVRSLLEERFGLKAHYETRVQPVYRLRVSKEGAKLKRAADTDHTSANWSAGLLKGTGVPSQFLAMMLSIPLERNVVDTTDLSGHFDIELHFLPRNSPPKADSDDPDLFTAVREQLGLRLEAWKAPVLVLVIDQIREPTPN